MKHADFTHIGEIAQTGELANRLSAGRNAGLTGVDASPHDIAKVRAFLATRKPEEVDEAAVLRASQLGVELRVIYDYRFPRDKRGNPLPFKTLIKGVRVVGDASACKEAAKAIRILLTSADIQQIEGWLAELSVIVCKRQDDDFTETLRLEVFTKLLCRYPADVASAAILGHTWQFWPSWYELEAICEQLSAPRRAMLQRLDPERHPVPGSCEANQRLAASAAEIAGEIWGDPHAF